MLPQSAQDGWHVPKDVGALEWRRRLLGELAHVRAVAEKTSDV